MNYDYKLDETLSTNPIHLIENLFGLKQIVQSPTRVMKASSSLIDIILTSCPQKHSYTGVQAISLSDHYMTYTVIDISHKNRKHREIKYRNYSKFNHEVYIKELSDIFLNLDNELGDELNKDIDENTIDKCWELWKNNFIKISDKHAPFTIRRLKNRVNPWITREIIKLIYEREYLHRKSLKEGNPSRKDELWSDYKRKRNLVTKTIKKAKLDFYSKVTNECHNNPKKLWSHIREALPKQTKHNINDISAEKFNEYFSEVGSKVAASCESEQYKCSLQDSIHEFKFNQVNDDVLIKMLDSLPCSSKNDILGFDSKLLKLSANIISPSLTKLINASLRIGHLPSDWKRARVSPAYKGKGEFNNENNYRPLSVIAHIAKIVESCVQKQLIHYLYEHKFICSDQFAYLKYHSTQLCLHRLIDDVLENINNNEITGMCFLDIRKCFDTINHEILLHKLTKYGILESELKWFTSYLTSRSQVVSHNGSISAEKFINIGVPQGTILAPILFLLYVNDISNVVTDAQINIFADDVVIYSSHDDFNLCVEKCSTMVIQNRSPPS